MRRRGFGLVVVAGTLLVGMLLGNLPAGAAPCPFVCPADFNGDCQVNDDDIFAFLEVWHALLETDFNQDGNVTADDVDAFLDAWFATLPSADANSDGRVTADDIYYFLNDWFLVTGSHSTDFDGNGWVTNDADDFVAFLAQLSMPCP